MPVNFAPPSSSGESQHRPPTWCQPIETPYGKLVAVWTARGLFSCSFDETSSGVEGFHHTDQCANTLWQVELAAAFDEYFRSGVMAWNLDRLDWTGVTEFRSQVLRSCYEIASGQTLTYGQLASRVGSPGAARGVGNAMATNRWPLLIPCHRVVGAGGNLVGYSGAGGLKTKACLLEFERRAVVATHKDN